MSLSSFLIRPPGVQTAPAEKPLSTPAPRLSRGGGASFAAVMADKGITNGQDGASPLTGKGAGSKSAGALNSAVSVNMRPSHAGWNPGGIPLAGDRSGVSPRPGRASGAGDAPGFALKADDFIHTRAGNVKKAAGYEKSAPATENAGIGLLSARFESGGDGIAAIGYDRMGGTSYGKYQIASRVGGMKDFLKFLDARAPDMAERLRKGGTADTGGRRGKMPEIWRQIAREEPERFNRLQEDFIRESHYKPALTAIVERTRLREGSISSAMREVIWSTAVQHGPAGAARLFDRADDMSGKETGAAYERRLISNVYALRAGQFGSSSGEVQASVARRFVQEKKLALNMLDAGGAASALA
jgi:hypothetical protein